MTPLRRISLAGTLLAMLLAGPAAGQQPPSWDARPVFSFQSNFWVNLHHFLRAVGRGMPAPADLDPAERKTWDSVVARYRERYVERDLLFDEGMVAINDTLRKVGARAKVPPVPGEPELKDLLESAAPIYRKHWWPAHDAINRSWIASVEPLVARWGKPLAARLAASYGETWPAEPHPVDVSVQAGPVGAYTSYPPHTTIASVPPGPQGLAALEILFHEASHRWGRALGAAIASSAERAHRDVPKQLWHAVLFHDAGELTRRILEQDGYGGYLEYAAAERHIYPDLCGDGCRDRIAAAWDPFLDGKRTREAAIDALVASWPQSPAGGR